MNDVQLCERNHRENDQRSRVRVCVMISIARTIGGGECMSYIMTVHEPALFLRVHTHHDGTCAFARGFDLMKRARGPHKRN